MNLLDLTRNEMGELLAGWGYGRFHADALWKGLYRTPDFGEREGFPDLHPDLQRRLADFIPPALPETVAGSASVDGTQKFLLRLADGETVETVLMKFEGRKGGRRVTACVSTQIGCAMGCVFCATGQMGFNRHLTPGEIVAQVNHVRREAAKLGETLRNIVFMGMGEPLHNYEAVMTAVRILTDHKGLAIAPKHITISTVGVVPGILKLADESTAVRLAVSLHGATDVERQALVPPAQRWPLSELMAACRTYTKKRKRRIFFEWTLIEGKNDTIEQAKALGNLLSGMAAHINLIPLNPTMGFSGHPTRPTAVREFQARLSEYGLPSTVRQRRGIDIAAGCGQLKIREMASGREK